MQSEILRYMYSDGYGKIFSFFMIVLLNWLKVCFEMWQRAFHVHCRRYFICYELELLYMMFGECSHIPSSAECPTRVFHEFGNGHAIQALTANRLSFPAYKLSHHINYTIHYTSYGVFAGTLEHRLLRSILSISHPISNLYFGRLFHTLD